MFVYFFGFLCREMPRIFGCWPEAALGGERVGIVTSLLAFSCIGRSVMMLINSAASTARYLSPHLGNLGFVGKSNLGSHGKVRESI